MPLTLRDEVAALYQALNQHFLMLGSLTGIICTCAAAPLACCHVIARAAALATCWEREALPPRCQHVGMGGGSCWTDPRYVKTRPPTSVLSTLQPLLHAPRARSCDWPVWRLRRRSLPRCSSPVRVLHKLLAEHAPT